MRRLSIALTFISTDITTQKKAGTLQGDLYAVCLYQKVRKHYLLVSWTGHLQKSVDKI